jgi:hypothetical protein
MLGSVGGHKIEVFRCTDHNSTQMGHGVSRSHKHVKSCNHGMIIQNPNKKCDQPITYASKLLNNAKKNYTATKRKTLAMVYALHKFKHYLLENKFVFYVDHMALLYLIKKPQLSR